MCMYVSEICAEGIFVTSWWLKNVKSRSKIALFFLNEHHFEIWFPKKRTITFFWSKLSKLHKNDPILHVATTFSLKQGETRTSHGPIPHPLSWNGKNKLFRKHVACNLFLSLREVILLFSSIASPICQEGQSERNFLIFAFSSQFFLIFPSFSRFLAIFFAVRGGTLPPPCHPSGYATASLNKKYIKLDSCSNAKRSFHHSPACTFVFVEVINVYPIDIKMYIPRVMPLHELKQVQLQERFRLMTHDSIGHLKMLCMSVLSLSGSVVCLNGNAAAQLATLDKCSVFK